ncbi:MAG: hypothetical protein NTZ50_04190 [Chloroflexi bacterium]|nr:hypothetical protein [Chloroflexota bacterium]
MTPRNIFALAAGAQYCYAATNAGLWKWTADGGAWKQLAPQFAPVALTAVVTADDTVLIGANGDIAVSRDGTRTFGLAALPVKAQVLALAISPNFAADHIALAATTQDGVLRSTDGGATFHAWNFGLIDMHVNALLVSPDFAHDATIFAATDHAVFQSTNSGRAWRELPLPAEAVPCTALAFGHKGALLVGIEGAGLWSAPAPYTTFAREARMPADEINALATTPRGACAATSNGIYIFTGRTWKRIHTAEDALALAVSADGTAFAGTAEGAVFLISE